MAFDEQLAETRPQTQISSGEITVLTDQSYSADETMASFQLRGSDLLLATAVNPGSNLLEGVAEQFAGEVRDAFDTGELILPGYERATVVRQQEVLAEAVLGEAASRMETPAITILHEQVRALEDQLTAANLLANPDTRKLIAENEALKKKLELSEARSDIRIKSLQSRIADIATIAADKKIEGPYAWLRVLRARGTLALHAVGLEKIS